MGQQRGPDRAFVQGNTGHDEADSGRPVKIGGKVTTGTPTAVADADRVDGWFDEYGRLHVIDNQAINVPGSATQGPTTFTLNTATATQLIGAQGAGNYIDIQSIFASNSSSSNETITFYDGDPGAGGTARMRAMLHKEGGGFVWTAIRQDWRLQDNTPLFAQLTTGVTSVYVTIMWKVGT